MHRTTVHPAPQAPDAQRLQRYRRSAAARHAYISTLHAAQAAGLLTPESVAARQDDLLPRCQCHGDRPTIARDDRGRRICAETAERVADEYRLMYAAAQVVARIVAAVALVAGGAR